MTPSERCPPRSLLINCHGLLGVAAAVALLLAGPSRAHAVALNVDPGNSPFTVSSNVTYDGVFVGFTGTGVLNHSAGTLTDTGSLYLASQSSSANGTYNLSGTGALSAQSELVGYRGSGTFTQSAGSNTLSGDFYVGYFGGSIGSYNLSFTGALSAANEYIGYFGSGTFTQSGGTHTVSGTLYLGFNGGSSSTYTLSGGALSAVEEYIGYGDSCTFTQSGGTNTVSNILTLSGDAGSSGTYKLNGGTLTTPGVTPSFGTSILNFNGGTLRPKAGNNSFVQGLTTANVQAGGAKIDSNSFDVTVAQALLHDTNAPATDGGLTKSGLGTLTLSATNTYTGATTVSVGALAISGRLANTNGIVLNNGGTLSLSGSTAVTDRFNDAAAVTIKGGGTFATGGLKEGTAPTAAGGVGGTAGLGALTLSTTTSSARATFDFANTSTGSTLVFSSLDPASKLAFAKVLNWTGTPGSDAGSSTNDRLLFQTNPGLTAADLANFQFSNDSGVNYASGAVLINYNGYYELVPPAPSQAPAITSANATTFTVGSAGTFTVTATGAPAPTVTQTGTLPNGVTFDSATAKLSGTPAAGTGGTYPITFTASNGVGSNAVQSFTLAVNQSPAITSANATTFVVGSAGSFTVTTTGSPNPTASQTGTLPSGVTFSAATKTLSGTPAAGTGGSYSISFKAANGVGTDATQTFTLTVNQAPAITSGNSATFTVGQAGTFTVTATGFPSPSLSESGALPAGVAFATNTGVLSGTPGPDTQGSYPVTMMASNGIGSAASQPFTLTVNALPCTAAVSGMIMWLPANNNANDLIGSNNAVLQSGATYGTGEVGQAFSLVNAPNAASGQYVNVATPVGLPVGNAARTVEMWFNTATTLTSSPNAALFQYGAATLEKSFGLVFTATNPGKLMFNGTGDALVGTTTVTPNAWHHVAVTYDGANVKLYLDGQLEGTKATSVLNTTLDGDGLTIGSRPGISVFNGKLDEVQIFTRALSQAEIQATYYAGAQGTCAPALTLISAASRKTHVGVGIKDVALPLSATVGVEPRTGAPTLVFNFSHSVVSGSAAVTAGTGSVNGAPTFSGNTMMVPLTGVTNAQQITVTLSSVTDALSQVLPPTAVNAKFLAGDVNGDGSVNSGDAILARNRSGQNVDDTNFRTDLNADGAINGGDAIVVRNNSGASIGTAPQ